MKNKVENKISFYVPGYKPGNIEYAVNMSIKNIVFCLEDGTPENKKVEARYLVKYALKSLNKKNKEFIVRINGVETKHWKKDLDAIIPFAPDKIRIPMVQYREDVDKILDYIKKIKPKNIELPVFEIMMENDTGVENLENILKNISLIESVTVGGEDLLKSFEEKKIKNPKEKVRQAKIKICNIANIYNKKSFDTTFMDYKNIKGFIEDSKDSINLGFFGRSIMHPDQISYAFDIYNGED